MNPAISFVDNCTFVGHSGFNCNAANNSVAPKLLFSYLRNLYKSPCIILFALKLLANKDRTNLTLVVCALCSYERENALLVSQYTVCDTS